jgi:hypothetical protein
MGQPWLQFCYQVSCTLLVSKKSKTFYSSRYKNIKRVKHEALYTGAGKCQLQPVHYQPVGRSQQRVFTLLAMK